MNNVLGKFAKPLFRYYKRFRYSPTSNWLEDGNNMFFVTGRSKSGTTWLAKILNSHPKLFCDFTENNPCHQDLRMVYYNNDKYFMHEKAKMDFERRNKTLICNGLKTTLIERCNKYNVTKIGDKTPRQDIVKLLEYFPKSQIIIIIRDPRDVLVSLAFHNSRVRNSWKGFFKTPEMKFLDNKFIEKYLSNYKSHKDIETYLELRKRHVKKQIIIIKYEDLKINTFNAIYELLSFLNVKNNRRIVNKIIKKIHLKD